jgi:hypothetical protein
MTQPLHAIVHAWLNRARPNLARRAQDAGDHDELAALLDTAPPRPRLLYLHADGPSIYASLVAMAQHEPVPGHTIELNLDGNWPYRCVHDALIDGWRVVQFPDQRAPFDDAEIDVLGYEFILEKWEEVPTRDSHRPDDAAAAAREGNGSESAGAAAPASGGAEAPE